MGNKCKYATYGKLPDDVAKRCALKLIHKSVAMSKYDSIIFDEKGHMIASNYSSYDYDRDVIEFGRLLCDGINTMLVKEKRGTKYHCIVKDTKARALALEKLGERILDNEECKSDILKQVPIRVKSTPRIEYNPESQTFVDLSGNVIYDLRTCGRIDKLHNGAQIQDTLGNLIAKYTNEVIEDFYWKYMNKVLHISIEHTYASIPDTPPEWYAQKIDTLMHFIKEGCRPLIPGEYIGSIDGELKTKLDEVANTYVKDFLAKNPVGLDINVKFALI